MPCDVEQRDLSRSRTADSCYGVHTRHVRLPPCLIRAVAMGQPLHQVGHPGLSADVRDEPHSREHPARLHAAAGRCHQLCPIITRSARPDRDPSNSSSPSQARQGVPGTRRLSTLPSCDSMPAAFAHPPKSAASTADSNHYVQEFLNVPSRSLEGLSCIKPVARVRLQGLLGWVCSWRGLRKSYRPMSNCTALNR